MPQILKRLKGYSRREPRTRPAADDPGENHCTFMLERWFYLIFRWEPRSRAVCARALVGPGET